MGKIFLVQLEKVMYGIIKDSVVYIIRIFEYDCVIVNSSDKDINNSNLTAVSIYKSWNNSFLVILKRKVFWWLF
jgi:hypothetical protein